ncbi:MAG: DUF3365 domain-containing protein [Piscinibacter sp.]|nr:DUF3365 domain-containing protein [Piscinibacter sp.]
MPPSSKRAAPRPASRAPALTALLVLFGALGGGAWWTAESLVMSQSVSEGRTVADMVENVGRWASQYGGIHVRTIGTEAKIPGSFLTRAVYAANGGDAAVLTGSRASQSEHERDAMGRVEAYHWKNPALVQREVADVIAASGSKARYRLTARTVLNTNNAPNAFETEAMDALQAADGARAEYWTVRAGQLLYARAVVAQKSCLSCHASADKAPDFLRTNAQFNGGGGFGYVENKPVGVISVALPLPHTWQALSGSLPVRVWAAFGVAALAALALLATLARRPRRG